MTQSTSSSRTAYVTVTLTARGSLNLEDDAQRASLAVAEWLDGQDTRTLADDFRAYAEYLETGDETDASRRHEALCNAARALAYPVATEGWLNRGSEMLTVDIEPVAEG